MMKLKDLFRTFSQEILPKNYQTLRTRVYKTQLRISYSPTLLLKVNFLEFRGLFLENRPLEGGALTHSYFFKAYIVMVSGKHFGWVMHLEEDQVSSHDFSAWLFLDCG